MVLIRYKIPLIILALLLFLLLSGCEIKSNDQKAEVDIRNNLSVQILYRQISYNCTVSCNNGTVYMEYTGNGDFPDGVKYIIDSSQVTSVYKNMKEISHLDSYHEGFLPKIIYEFFSSFDGVIEMTDKKGEGYNYIRKTVNKSVVEFRVNYRSELQPYTIVIS